ncbi:MAG: cytochrome c oxidase assembly protein [Thermomicrobiales bacterium]
MFSFITLIPLLHTGGPEPTGPTYSHWVLDPKIAVYVFGITALYLAWVGPLNRRRPGVQERPVKSSEIRWFLLGSLAALVALGPPLDDWSDWFFLSAHMFQHLLLMTVVVPCWLAGIPAWVYRPILARRWSSLIFRNLLKPAPAYLLATVIMVGWHVPYLYNLSLSNDMIHAVQHQFFILAGILIWWPIMSKVPEAPPLSAPLQCVYLFLLTIPSAIVGAFITYAGTGLYSAYNRASVLPFGFSMKNDQEVAGLMMWVGMNALFLILLTFIFLRWANKQEAADRDSSRPRPQPVRDAPRLSSTTTTAPVPVGDIHT